MKDFADLLESEYVRNWLTGFYKHTRWNYLRFLELFCEYSGKDPDQLMSWVRQDRTMVHLKVKEFYEHLSKIDPATSDRTMGYNAITSFGSEFGPLYDALSAIVGLVAYLTYGILLARFLPRFKREIPDIKTDSRPA